MTGFGPGYGPPSQGPWEPTGFGNPDAPATGRGRGADLAVAIPLAAVHLLIAVVAVMVIGFAGMGLDPCSYRACGDPRWATIALTVVLIAAVALPVADLTFIIARSARRRPTWPIPLAFCAAHLVVGAVCFALMVAAGPQ